MKPSADVYQQVTDSIVKAIEAGAKGWQMPWHTVSGSGNVLDIPHNITGRAYRGANVPLLWAAQLKHGYSSNRWGTYRQFQEAGAQVRKGEKSTLIIFWKSYTKENRETGEEETFLTARSYAVFNIAQVDGYQPKRPAVPVAPVSEEARIAAVEAFFAATGARIEHGGNRAFYSPGSDFIRMPKFEQFRDFAAYYATLAHETVHWSGAKGRMDREFGARFGDRAYAFEELVAELGAAFLCATLGLSNEPREDHAQYLASWLGCLKEDSRAIFTAASKAQAAVDFICGLSAETAEEPEELPIAA